MSNFNYMTFLDQLLYQLRDDGYFVVNNFLEPELCDSISKKIIDFGENIDKTSTKEYDTHIVHSFDKNMGTDELDKLNKPVINVRGGNVDYDTNFCDFFQPELLFEEINEIKNRPLFEHLLSKLDIKNEYGTDIEVTKLGNPSNIYYTNGINNTRGWHKDAPMIKFFVYLTDVLDEDDGPYCYVPKSHTLSYDRVINPNEYFRNHIKFLCKKGTLICTLQQGTHRGWPQGVNNKRVMLTNKVYLDNREFHRSKVTIGTSSGSWSTELELDKIFGEHLVRKDILEKYPFVINAGVHEGQEMHNLMDMVNDVNIYALEPSNRCYNETFTKFSSHKNIKFIKKAIVGSERKGKVQFTDFISNGKQYEYGGLQELSEFRQGNEVYEVETTNIRELLNTIDSDIGFFKADIEGAEYEIIMDFDESIASKIKQIALEVQNIPTKSYIECRDDIVNKLVSLGYIVYTHINGDGSKDNETHIINGEEFTSGGLYAIRKDELDLIQIDKTVDSYNHQTLASHEHKFLYQPIPKCACRTIKTWMILLHKKSDILEQILSEYGTDIPTGLMYDKFNDELSKKNIDIHGLSRDIFPTFNTNKNIDSYFKFTFVRNPYLRLAAAYQEKFKHPVHGLYYPNAKILNDFVKQETNNDKEYFDEDGVIPFETFVDILYVNAKDNNYRMFDVHWLPQYLFIESQLNGKCDFIGKIENMEDDFKNLIKEINVDFYPEFKIGGTKNLQFYSSMYKDKEIIDKVTEIYEQDLKRFNYSFLDWEK